MWLKDVGVEPRAPHPVCLCHTRTQRQPGLSQLRMAHHLFHRRRLIEGLPILHTAYTIIHTTSLTRIKPTASLLATLYMLYIMYKTHTHLHTSADASLHQDITPPPSVVC